jgi:hypothetical protein
MCLELMIGNDFFKKGTDKANLAEIHQRLPTMSKNGE